MVAKVLYIVYVLRCPRQWSQWYPMCVRGLTSASLKSCPTFKASNALLVFISSSVSNSYLFTTTVFLLINKFMQNAPAPRYPSIHLIHKLDSPLWLTLEGLLFFTLNYTYTASITCPVFQSIYIRTLLWSYRVFLFFSILFFLFGKPLSLSTPSLFARSHVSVLTNKSLGLLVCLEYKQVISLNLNNTLESLCKEASGRGLGIKWHSIIQNGSPLIIL